MTPVRSDDRSNVPNAEPPDNFGGPGGLGEAVPLVFLGAVREQARAQHGLLYPAEHDDLTPDLADRLTHALSAPMPAEGVVAQVGASVGTATGAEAADGEDLLSRADHAMFDAKRARRAQPRAA